jgi:uncharacterized protein (TIGR00255 family)
MIKSMTGFGKGKSENKSISVETEIKSINSRYLDIFLKLPPNFYGLDYELREYIKNKISRGKVSAAIQIKFKKINDKRFSIDGDKLKSFVSTIKEIKKISKAKDEIKLEHILSNKDIFLSEENEISEDNIDTIKNSIDSALTNLTRMKVNEGKELEKDLQKRIKIIEKNLSDIEEKSSESIKENFENMKLRAQTLVKNITEYSERLEAELALLAEKSDITEECIRLRSHMKFFEESVKNDEEAGRRLNFLCQEMHREINTISSKTISSDITHKSVLIKEEIEKIREQVQNIE